MIRLQSDRAARAPSAPPKLLVAWTALFEEISDGVCISDSEFRILYLNEAARKIMRLDERPRGEMTVCELVTVTLPSAQIGRCTSSCPLLRSANAGSAATTQLPGVRVRCLAAPEGMGQFHLTLLEDNRTEEDLRRHQEDWRNMVAHDLRTPLTPVLATLAILLENPAVGPQDRRLVELAIGSAKRMLDLLSLYLDVARLSAGLMPVAPAPLALAPLLEAAADGHAAVARRKRLAFTWTAPDGLRAAADPALLPRVLDNLVSNAVKFTPEGGSIEMTAEASGSTVRVSIRDSGPGIAPDGLARIFDRFYQAEARRNGRTQGTGLGLAFCREAVEAMGGRIHAYSEPGRGSEFAVVLPAAGAATGTES
ncbi:MAG: PAS domain-containing sensor histidine kinase [Elusimicrobia bacterium]|nr:PAS domain-containing sensor histidine kinase [Elusimicrobiota bacterium]